MSQLIIMLEMKQKSLIIKVHCKTVVIGGLYTAPL